MSTRGCVAVGDAETWVGVYNHSDSYPEAPHGLGKRVWDLLQEDVERFRSTIVGHPGGWSQWNYHCYCHSPTEEMQEEYVRRMTEALGFKPSRGLTDFSLREGSAAVDSPHYRKDAPDGRMNQRDADPLHIEWVYVYDERIPALHVIKGRYQPREFVLVDTLPLDLPEPDWDSIGQIGRGE